MTPSEDFVERLRAATAAVARGDAVDLLTSFRASGYIVSPEQDAVAESFCRGCRTLAEIAADLKWDEVAVFNRLGHLLVAMPDGKVIVR